MSAQITEAFVKQYANQIFHLSQQKGSRLQSLVRRESQNGESRFFERLGSVVAIERTSRHADTPQLDTPHSRRRVTLTDYEYADLIDDADRLRLLIDPTSPYSQAAVWALGRAKDDKLISAALGTAYSGSDGSTSVAFPNTQKIVSTNSAGSAGANMNVEALRRAKQVLDAADVDESIPRYCAISASQLQSLLAETEVTSSDYNSVRALVMGQLNTFMGFHFVRLERLVNQEGALAVDFSDGTVGSGGGDADGYRRAFCWAQDGIVLSTGQDIRARISERPDKSYSTQVYASMGIGATRLEEEKVVEILCNEA